MVHIYNECEDIQQFDFDNLELCMMLMEILNKLQMVIDNTKLLIQYNNHHFYFKKFNKSRLTSTLECTRKLYLYSHKSDATDFIPYNASVTTGVNSVPADDEQVSVEDKFGQISLSSNSDT